MNNKSQIFSNKSNMFENVKKHFLEAESLPAACYKDRDFYNAEIEMVFLKSWLFVGRKEKLPCDKSYFVVDLLNESLIITKDEDGDIHAFQNLCRHRGARLLDDNGTIKHIRCPYHNWAYSLTGELIGAPDMQRTKNFCKKNNGLIKVKIESWAGFLFINFDHNSISLLEYLGDLPKTLENYDLSNMLCVKETYHQVACNWKLYTEVDMEDYHAPTVHPLSIGRQIFPRQPSNGEYETTFFEHPKTVSVIPTDKGPTFPSIDGISGKAATGTYFTMIYPGFFLVTTLDSCWWINKIPINATNSEVHVGYCFPASTVKREDFNEISLRYIERWDRVIDEDNKICERHQSGINSRWCLPGRLSFHEEVVNAMNKWLIEKIQPNKANQNGQQ
ncbi:3-phenylpropionate/cinnamic acid dioxygenase subunit alpha [Pseudomonas fluorescens]|nr:3-phenylpropionate/cinnamic acid dioxygenase subunit alpha [Pseudomonas fluorescens]